MSPAGEVIPRNANDRHRKFGVVMEAREDARPRPQRPRRLEVRRYSTLKSVAPDHPDTRALGVGGSAVSWTGTGLGHDEKLKHVSNWVGSGSDTGSGNATFDVAKGARLGHDEKLKKWVIELAPALVRTGCLGL